MKRIICTACAAALLSGTAQAQQHFTFTAKLSHTTNSTGAVTGTFDGTLNGNLITGLSNIHVFLDGVAFKGNGALYNASTDSKGNWTSGTAVASLDGTQNNLLFVDSDFPSNANFSNYFFSITQLPGQEAFNSNTNQSGYADQSDFRAQLAGVPEPASWALMIGGFGLAGAALRASRRKTSVRYA